ncbi:MAG: hypothetical protein ACTHKL_17110 [Streptosporangiaceae bacterium]
MALPFLRTSKGDNESHLAESDAAGRDHDDQMVSRRHGGAEGTSTRRPAVGQRAWSPTMIASDIASSDAEPGWAAGDAGWPEAPDGEDYGPADDAALRSHAYRQLWSPPGHRSGPRQAIGQPYVWDGGRLDLEAHPFVEDEESDAREAARTSGQLEPMQRPDVDALTGPTPFTERAVIGDYLRELAAWCQIGACIARHTDITALGEVDIRNKAVAAGWCVDLFGRLICPSCQQRDAVWSARPLLVRDRPGDLVPMSADAQIGRHRRARWPTPKGVDAVP